MNPINASHVIIVGCVISVVCGLLFVEPIVSLLWKRTLPENLKRNLLIYVLIQTSERLLYTIAYLLGHIEMILFWLIIKAVAFLAGEFLGKRREIVVAWLAVRIDHRSPLTADISNSLVWIFIVVQVLSLVVGIVAAVLAQALVLTP